MITREQATATVDHSMLGHCCTKEDVKKFADAVLKYGFKSLVVGSDNVVNAVNFVEGRAKVASVISFPQGASTTKMKITEAVGAIRDGASEVDVVVNFSRMREKNYDYVKNEIADVVKAVKDARADALTKFIIYMPYDQNSPLRLTEEESKIIGEFIIEGGGDFIKYHVYHDFMVKTFGEEVRKGNIQLKWSGCPDLPSMIKALEQGVTRIGHDSVDLWMENGGEEFFK